MIANELNKLILSLENLLLKAELHNRFSMEVIPLKVEKRINIPSPHRIKYN
jgi:hypothetical protein